MKLLIITQSIDRNNPVLGFFHRWVEEFSKKFESIVVICLEKGEYSLPPNVKVLSLGKENYPLATRNEPLFQKVRYALTFWKLIWQERKNYDVVFVHMNPIYIVLGGIYWRILGKKIGLWYLHRSVDLKLILAEKLTHFIFTASELSCRVRSRKKIIVGHGIDTNQYISSKNFSTSGIFNVISVGRISPIKNYEPLIKATSQILKKGKRINLQIIGGPAVSTDKKYFKLLQDMVRKENLGDNIKFTGPISHDLVPRYLASADLFINLSDTGSMDKAVLEAMSTGVPVLTSNVAFKEILKPEFLFENRNSSDLADKISFFIDNKSLREETGKKLRQVVVEKYNLKDLIIKVVDLYNA